MPNTRRFLSSNLSLELSASDDSHLILKDRVSLLASELSIEKKIENQLLIVVDEIFSNIVKYAKVTADSIVKIEFSFNADDESLELKFIDAGIAYNPLEAKIPDVNASIEDREIGGLGIFMVKKMMDKVTYTREGDFNVLSLVKHLKAL